MKKCICIYLHPHLVNMQIRYLHELVSICCHFWDLDVQLQIGDGEIAQVLYLREDQERTVNYIH